MRRLCIVLERETRAQSLYFNHSHVFVLTLKYGTASDGMAAANGCARAGSKLNQCLFIALNATIAACATLTGFGKRFLCLRYEPRTGLHACMCDVNSLLVCVGGGGSGNHLLGTLRLACVVCRVRHCNAWTRV